MAGAKAILAWLDEAPKRRKKPTSLTQIRKRPRPGRPAIHETFPESVDAARRFIEENGFQAHRRRLESVGTCGSSLSSIRDHLLSTVPGLKEAHPNFGVRSVARYLNPPNRSTKSSADYKGLIDARIPSKKNSARKENDNAHFYFSRVRYFLECASKHSSDMLVYSADNKNKVKVSENSSAVDRRMEIRKVFPSNDKPNYKDHDFPTRGYQITPSGYLELEPTNSKTTDELGRDHYVIPRKGVSKIFLRSPMSPISVCTHLNDITKVLENKNQSKSVLLLLVDGGPDFNCNFGTNIFYYSRFFFQHNLDALIVTTYCPGQSAYNPVEHLWAPCTHALTSVYLPDSLPHDTNPPCDQPILTAEGRQMKERQVFDKAMERMRDSYWKNLKFAGHKVNVEVEPSAKAPHPYGSDYETTKKIIGKSARQLRMNYPEYQAELIRNAKHMDRRIGTLMLMKCKSCPHCTANPIRCSPELLETLRSFPSPSPSPDHPDHFTTFQEALNTTNSRPCQYLPLFVEKGLGRCEVHGCRYVFNSKTDQNDHKQKIHKE